MSKPTLSCLLFLVVGLVAPTLAGDDKPTVSLPDFDTVTIDASEDVADVDGLVKQLDSPDEAARIRAIDTLGEYGEGAAAAIPALVTQLKDKSALVRAHAANALGEMGSAAKPAVADMVPLLGDSSQIVRRETIQALGLIRPGPEVSLPLLEKLLEDSDPAVQNHVLHTLAEIGEPAVPLLTKGLANDKVAYAACLVLGEIGPAAAPAVPALIKRLSDPRPQVVQEAILCLGKIGPKAAAAVPNLVDLLDTKAPGTDLAVTHALGKIGPAAKEASKRIAPFAASQDPVLAAAAAWAMARINPDSERWKLRATNALVGLLKNENQLVREAAVRALAELRPGPALVIPALQKAFQGADEKTVNAALDAMATAGEAAVPGLAKALKIPTARRRAAMVLSRIGPAAKEAVPNLIEALSDKDPLTRREILFALAAIGPDAQDAVPVLIEVLDDPDKDVSATAVFALGGVGPAALPAKSKLVKNLDGNDEFLAAVSAWALAQICPTCEQTAVKSVPLLVKALGDSESEATQVEAAGALAALGPLARPAVPALQAALKDKSRAVREAARKALDAVGK